MYHPMYSEYMAALLPNLIFHIDIHVPSPHSSNSASFDASKVVCEYSPSHLCEEEIHKVHVVQRGKHVEERLAHPREVVEVRSARVHRVERWIYRSPVALILALLDVHRPLAREQRAVPRNLLGVAAVERIDPKGSGCSDRRRVCNPEQVYRALPREQLCDEIYKLEHLRTISTQRAADGHTIDWECGEILGRLHSELSKNKR